MWAPTRTTAPDNCTAQPSPAPHPCCFPAGPQPSDSLDHKFQWAVHSGCYHGVCGSEEPGEGMHAGARACCAADCTPPPRPRTTAGSWPGRHGSPPTTQSHHTHTHTRALQVINATVCPLYANPDPEYNYTIRQYDAGWKAATTYPCAGAGVGAARGLGRARLAPALTWRRQNPQPPPLCRAGMDTRGSGVATGFAARCSLSCLPASVRGKAGV